MDFTTKSGNPESLRTACVVVGVFEGRKLSEPARLLDLASQGEIAKIVRSGDMDGKLNQSLLLHNIPNIQAQRVLLIGCGRERDLTPARYRLICRHAATVLESTGAREAVSFLADLELQQYDAAARLRGGVEATCEALYRFDQLKSEPDKKNPPLKRFAFGSLNKRGLAARKRSLDVGQAIAAGVALAKDLGNLPGNHCTPTYLAQQAKALAKGRAKLKVEVLEQKDMEQLGMGALLSVAKGSRQPPKLIVLNYSGGKRGDRPHALVGKGITFDSGGISIKPSAAMDEMKYDMCGAASVLGTFKACVALALPINLVGIIPTCENLPDGAASKPGDIVTSMSGQTIEVLNTDAEGRLILSDALTYASKFKPKSIIDIATLTGACVIALGKHASGLLGNNEALIRQLLDAGLRSADRAWELPLWDEYQEQIKSPFADIANVGGRDAGTITAACFLSRFTKKYRWAHIDIAGTAWNSGDKKGATGRPVPLLTQYLIDRARA